MAEEKQDGNKRFQKNQNHPQTIINTELAREILAKVLKNKEVVRPKKNAEESLSR